MALVADIETRNWRQEFNAANNTPPEHPRSSTTDDIECFFSILRGTVGKHFTLKQVSLILCSVFVTKGSINEIKLCNLMCIPFGRVQLDAYWCPLDTYDCAGAVWMEKSLFRV